MWRATLTPPPPRSRLGAQPPDRVAAVGPEHAAYWRGLELREYLGGPFADRSRGLISFETDSQDDVAELVADDLFVREGLVERSWVKEWKVEKAAAPARANGGSRRAFG